SWTVMHNIGMQVQERTEYYTLANWVGALVALAGYALLIPRLLGLGAALATVASFGVREWMVYALSQRLWPVHYRWTPVIRLPFASRSVLWPPPSRPPDPGCSGTNRSTKSNCSSSSDRSAPTVRRGCSPPGYRCRCSIVRNGPLCIPHAGCGSSR